MNKNSSMKKMTNAEMNDYIKANYATKSNKDIGIAIGLAPGSVQKRAERMGVTGKKNLPKPTLDVQVKEDIVRSQMKQKLQDKESKYSYLIKQNENLQKLLDASKSLEDVNTYTIKTTDTYCGDATAFAVLSDWHFWETVYPERVDGLNEFNTKIAHKRADTCFQNIVKLVNREQKDSSIKSLVLALLGDFINGQINSGGDDNFGAVTHETMDVQNTLCSGIEFILKNTNVDLVIPCCSGNHGRITDKIKVSNEAGHSLEYFMYHQMANYFRNEKRVKFIITEGYFVYLDINNYTIRFHHGHNMRFAGGVGGIFIPANKAISQWNKGKHADLDVFGHFHQVKDGGNFVSNGSLVGYNCYALSIKADYEKPKQVFFLVNHKRKEKTTTCPIFLENQ